MIEFSNQKVNINNYIPIKGKKIRICFTKKANHSDLTPTKSIHSHFRIVYAN